MEIPDHLACLLRNLYAGQGATVRTGHGTTDWFQIGKGVCQACILLPCLHHAKCWAGWSTSWNQVCWVEYQQPQIWRYHSNGRKWRGTKETLDESEKAGLKLNIQKVKTVASGPSTSWQIDGETMETVTDFIFLGFTITTDGDCTHEIKRCFLLGRKAMTNLENILKSRDITLPTNVCLVKL